MRTIELLRRLDRRRYRLHFCALSGSPGELDDEVRRLGGRVHLLRRNLVGFPPRFRRLLDEHDFDVVHSQVLYYSGFILRLAAQCGVPVRVAQFQNSHDGRRTGPARWLLRRIMRRWIDRYATDIVAVSRGAMSAVWGPNWQSDRRCRVIYNGVDASRFSGQGDRGGVCRQFGLPPDSLLCIHVGRIAEQKNHLRLLAVFGELLNRRPQARLLLVGRGGNRLEKRLRRRIAELQIGPLVTLCGERADVPRLLGAADVMIFPSRWEGLPGAVQEACAAGTPVVAADLPGVREIAARLAGVHCLPLSASDRQWAETVDAVAARRRCDDARRRAAEAFAASQFAVDRVAQMNCRLWEGGATAGPHCLAGGKNELRTDVAACRVVPKPLNHRHRAGGGPN